MKKLTVTGILALILSLVLLTACGQPGVTPSTTTDIPKETANINGEEDVVVSGQPTGGNGQTAYLMLASFPATSFTNEAVADGYLDLILQAGLHADVLHEVSPCQFIVVKNPDIRAKLCAANDLCDVIVVTAPADEAFAAGAVTNSMYLMAQCLGLGCGQLSADTIAADAGLQAQLGIPDGHAAAAVLVIGNTTETAEVQLPDIAAHTTYAD